MIYVELRASLLIFRVVSSFSKKPSSEGTKIKFFRLQYGRR